MSYSQGLGNIKRGRSAIRRAAFFFIALFATAFWVPVEAEEKSLTNILFFGDSLTAGYGLDPSQAYPALIQEKIDAEGLSAKVQVGAVSGDTSAGGLRRIDWMLRQPVDLFVLALGANDGLRGVDLEDTKRNLQAILDRVAEKYPKAKLVVAGMRLPPSLGAEYADQFALLYPELADANQAALIPFLLEGVGGVVELNFPDRIHPNAKGHQKLAETVWAVLKPILANE